MPSSSGETHLDTIFVSLTPYRDPQLVPTVTDCLAKARHPERLRFGICWQHDETEVLPEWFGTEQFRILDHSWRDSEGLGWARSKVMGLWRGEEWYLQLDAHHRFVPDWDVLLIEEAARTGSDRPVLTTYGPDFDPDSDDSPSGGPRSVAFNSFSTDGIPQFIGVKSPQPEGTGIPRRARFASGHFFFAPGQFTQDVPYDPGLYFHGDEILLAVRAYTHGYDLHEPSQVILWHEYGRFEKRRQWNDHTGDSGPAWQERDRPSRTRAQRILTGTHDGPYGLGTVRTLAEYEEYAGINIRTRRVHDDVRNHLEPPVSRSNSDWSAATDDRHPTRRMDIQWTEADGREVATFGHRLTGVARGSMSLNRTAAFLVRAADGSRTTREIANDLRHTYELAADPIQEVTEFYRQAESKRLIGLWDPTLSQKD